MSSAIGDELAGADEPALRMLPARERLERRRCGRSRPRRSAGSGPRRPGPRSPGAGRFPSAGGSRRGSASPASKISQRDVCRLGAVQRDRGVAQDLFRPRVAGRADRDAGAGGREDLPAVDVEGPLQRGAQPLRDARGVARIVDVVEEHRELVAGEARQREPVPPRVGRVADRQAVCSRWAISTSSRSAVTRPRLALSASKRSSPSTSSAKRYSGCRAGPLDRALEQIDEQHAVRQAGQRVGDLGVGDVGQRSGEARGRAALVANRGAAAQDPAERAVRVQHPVLGLVVAAGARQVRGQPVSDAARGRRGARG